MHEISFNKEGLISPEWIEGHDFRIPTIEWGVGEYKIDGLRLPYDWETKFHKLEEKIYIRMAELHLGNSENWGMTIDDETGVITEIKLDKDEKRRVYLEDRAPRSGIYVGEDIKDLGEAIKYQRFLANYMSYISDFNVKYAYINNAGYGQSGSIDLTIPESIDLNKPVVYQGGLRRFEKKAWKITGMFGTELHDMRFDDKGILQYVWIDQNACSYDLDRSSRTYFPHNVDNMFAAATLHGIVAEYINELLREGSPESWR